MECSSPGFILWLTGLSGAGKSTLAQGLVRRLSPTTAAEILDGDDVRRQLWPELDFSRTARDANVLRIGHLARMLARNRVNAIVAAVSPYAETRRQVRQKAHDSLIPFVEVFVQASLDVLILRDPKGLYRKALAGAIKQFTGVSDPYEPPEQPDAIVHTDLESVDESLDTISNMLVRCRLVS